MKRTARFSPVLLVAALWPSFLQTSVTCDLVHDPSLRTLAVEADDIDRVVGFNRGTTHYDVWLDDAEEITVRAKAVDGVATILWAYGDDSGLLGIGFGDVTLRVVPGAELVVTTSVPRGGEQTYTVAIDPACGPGACDDANLCTTDVCDLTSQECEFWGESPCPLQGRLVGGPFAGVSWEALGTSVRRTGVLDRSSMFEYVPGRPVRFYVGETVIGEVQGAEELSLFDVVGMEPVIGMSNVSAMLADRTSRLHTLINVSVFLYTFDHDGDASNGVEITGETAAWFDSFAVDFGRDWMRFRHDHGLRVALSYVNGDRTLAEHRPVRNSAYAIQTLYEALGIDPRIFGPKRREYSEEAGSPAHAEEFNYDKWGNRQLRRWRYPDQNIYWAIYGGVDDNRNKYYWWTGPYPGIPDRLIRYEHDADDNLTRESIDWMANGKFEQHRNYEHDAYGQRLRDYTPGVTTWQYDDEGNQVLEYKGTTIRHMEYDAHGYKTRTLAERASDGAFEGEWLYEHDSRGDQIGWLYNHPLGVEDMRFQHAYDEAGNLVQWSAIRDGAHSETRTWAYDANGNAITMTSTVGEEMSPGPAFTSTYEQTGWAAALYPLPLFDRGSWPPADVNPLRQ